MLQEQQCEDDMVIREPLTNETTGEKFKGLLLKLCKKWWFWVILGSIGVLLMDAIDTSTTVNHYEKVDIETLYADLRSNPIRAEQLYKDEYVEIEGVISDIGEGLKGAYIEIKPSDSWLEFREIECYAAQTRHENSISKMRVGDKVTIKGKITYVNEYLGYEIEIHGIE